VTKVVEVAIGRKLEVAPGEKLEAALGEELQDATLSSRMQAGRGSEAGARSAAIAPRPAAAPSPQGERQAVGGGRGWRSCASGVRGDGVEQRAKDGQWRGLGERGGRGERGEGEREVGWGGEREVVASVGKERGEVYIRRVRQGTWASWL
jgi:hypothetical protein